MATRRGPYVSEKVIKGLNHDPATPERNPEYGARLEHLIEITTNSLKDTAVFQQESKERMARLELELLNIKKEMGHFKKIDETLNIIKDGLKDHENRITDIEDSMENLKDNFLRQEDAVALLEYAQKENTLRIRGISECDGEILSKRLMPLLQEVWDLEEEDAIREIDQLYRVNSRVAHDRKLPRDIIMHCVRKSLKDEILRYHSRQPLKLDGKTLIIMKEIPQSIQRRRKDYKCLTDTLRRNNITYRWIIPEGVSFVWSGKRLNINTVQRAQEISQKLKKTIQEKGNSQDCDSSALEVRPITQDRGVEGEGTNLICNGQTLIPDQGVTIGGISTNLDTVDIVSVK
ncbi:uncharacterized protein LOC125433936 [Sphaerodactylus townsendi]|uniref:uncharacterized protein LOC125433936 n=1 Tax=Sphaerodactylus townsendi TaxID=933632 RepID=UPI002026769D|nr:uncharacterized protein LOC125433936 [Sphaerodactylus townsendi]